MQAIKVILICDVLSGGKGVHAGTLLQILRYNESVARCLDAQGEAYVINSTDYICVLEYPHSSHASNLKEIIPYRLPFNNGSADSSSKS